MIFDGSMSRRLEKATFQPLRSDLSLENTLKPESQVIRSREQPPVQVKRALSSNKMSNAQAWDMLGSLMSS